MDEIQRTYYSIREVSDMFSVPLPTLRFWEKEIKQLKPRTVNQTRYYSQDDLDTIQRIMYLRAQNVPIKEMSRRLSIDRKGIDTRRKAYEQLQAIRKELTELRDMI